MGTIRAFRYTVRAKPRLRLRFSTRGLVGSRGGGTVPEITVSYPITTRCHHSHWPVLCATWHWCKLTYVSVTPNSSPAAARKLYSAAVLMVFVFVCVPLVVFLFYSYAPQASRLLTPKHFSHNVTADGRGPDSKNILHLIANTKATCPSISAVTLSQHVEWSWSKQDSCVRNRLLNVSTTTMNYMGWKQGFGGSICKNVHWYDTGHAHVWFSVFNLELVWKYYWPC